jgi:hypothetical protein
MPTPLPTAALGMLGCLVLDCPECRDARAFEQPPCGDDHEPCPEVICVECGTALVLGLASLPAALPAAPEVTLARSA